MGSNSTVTAADHPPKSLSFQSRRTSLVNTGFLYLKPHCNTLRGREFVYDRLGDSDSVVRIVESYPIRPERIQHDKILERGSHFRTDLFGEDWEMVVKEKRAVTAISALARWRLTGRQLEELWHEHESQTKLLAPGLYCGKLTNNNRNKSNHHPTESSSTLYVINGFYLGMKERYTTLPPPTKNSILPETDADHSNTILQVVTEENDDNDDDNDGQEEEVPDQMFHNSLIGNGDGGVYCFVVEWSGGELTWKEFLRNVVGTTSHDIVQTEKGSLQREIHDRREELGLTVNASVFQLEGAVHASKSPLEALSERCTWLGRSISQDPFGRALLGRGIPESTIRNWLEDTPLIRLPGEQQQLTLFQFVEQMDSSECMDRLVKVYDQELFGSKSNGTNCNCVIS
eukprot:scaffold177838_cov44-Attheya_sp.AAC.1